MSLCLNIDEYRLILVVGYTIGYTFSIPPRDFEECAISLLNPFR